MLSGMKESYKKGESESILAPSPAAGIVRCPSKRRQGYCLGKLNLDTGNWTFHYKADAAISRLVFLKRISAVEVGTGVRRRRSCAV